MKFKGNVNLDKSSLPIQDYYIDYSNGSDYTVISKIEIKKDESIEVLAVKILKNEVE